MCHHGPDRGGLKLLELKSFSPENEVPSVTGRLLTDEAAIETLQVPDVNKGRVPEYLKANRLAAEHLTDRPVLAGCNRPLLVGRPLV